MQKRSAKLSISTNFLFIRTSFGNPFFILLKNGHKKDTIDDYKNLKSKRITSKLQAHMSNSEQFSSWNSWNFCHSRFNIILIDNLFNRTEWKVIWMCIFLYILSLFCVTSMFLLLFLFVFMVNRLEWFFSALKKCQIRRRCLKKKTKWIVRKVKMSELAKLDNVLLSQNSRL